MKNENRNKNKMQKTKTKNINKRNTHVRMHGTRTNEHSTSDDGKSHLQTAHWQARVRKAKREKAK